MLNTIVIVIDVIAALFLILTILLHSGRGSGLSDMFGGSSTLARRHRHGAHARPHHRRHGGDLRPLHLLARLAVEPVDGPPQDRLVESARSTSEWRNLVDALG